MKIRLSNNNKLILINDTLFTIKMAEKASECNGCMYSSRNIYDSYRCYEFQRDIREKINNYECYSYIIKGKLPDTRIYGINLDLILLGSKLHKSLFLASYIKINNINFNNIFER